MVTVCRPMELKDLRETTFMSLKESDAEELKASSGKEPDEAILMSVAVSEEVYVIEHRGRIEAVGGVARSVTAGEGGVPWFVSTDRIAEFSKTLVKESLRLVDRWLDTYGRLSNFVASENIDARRLLERLGFTVKDEVDEAVRLSDPYFPFFYFYKNKEV